MLANFKRDTNSIISFLENNNAINKSLDGSMYDIPFLLRLSQNNELAKIVFSSKSSIFIKAKPALDKYIDNLQTLLYISILDVYMLFNRLDDITTFVNKLRKLQNKPVIYQLVKYEFKQKMVVMVVDEDCIKEVKTLSNETITIEQVQMFGWEVTINDVLYENYSDILECFDRLINEINCTGKVFLSPQLIKKSHKYCRYNLSSLYDKQPLQKILKSTLQYDVIEKPNKPKTNTKTQNIINWIKENIPTQDEDKIDYYNRYVASGQDVSKQIFTKCIKQLGYIEHKIKNKIYWKEVKEVEQKLNSDSELIDDADEDIQI